MLATLRRQQDRAMIPRLIPSEDGMEIGNKTGTDEEKHAAERRREASRARRRRDRDRPELRVCNRDLRAPGRGHEWGIDNDALTTGARISRTILRLLFRRADQHPTRSARSASRGSVIRAICVPEFVIRVIRVPWVRDPRDRRPVGP